MTEEPAIPLKRFHDKLKCITLVNTLKMIEKFKQAVSIAIKEKSTHLATHNWLALCREPAEHAILRCCHSLEFL